MLAALKLPLRTVATPVEVLTDCFLLIRCEAVVAYHILMLEMVRSKL